MFFLLNTFTVHNPNMNSTFTQNHSEEVPIHGISKGQFLDLAIETSKSLGWTFGNVTERGFTAYTTNGVFNWNAEIQLQLNDSSAKLLSRSRNIRSIEFGKDKKNVENFLATFNALKSSIPAVEISSYMNVA